jgi:acetyl esterase/lipase
VDVQRIVLKLLSRLPGGLVRIMSGKPIVGRGVQLDPMMQLLWIAGKKQPPLESMTPAEVRAGLETAARTLQADLPAPVNVREDAIAGPGGPIPVRIYTPAADSGSLPLTLFFHFGGFVIGSRNICHGFCGILAHRANSIVVNVEYRLAPEHPFPAPLEDALAAYRWAIDNAARLGGDPARIAVAGDSSGALSAAVICQEARRQNWQPPRCQLLIYPWLVPYSGLPSYQDFADA